MTVLLNQLPDLLTKMATVQKTHFVFLLELLLTMYRVQALLYIPHHVFPSQPNELCHHSTHIFGALFAHQRSQMSAVGLLDVTEGRTPIKHLVNCNVKVLLHIVFPMQYFDVLSTRYILNGEQIFYIAIIEYLHYLQCSRNEFRSTFDCKRHSGVQHVQGRLRHITWVSRNDSVVRDTIGYKMEGTLSLMFAKRMTRRTT